MNTKQKSKIFPADDIRAFLAGRKTMFREPLKVQPVIVEESVTPNGCPRLIVEFEGYHKNMFGGKALTLSDLWEGWKEDTIRYGYAPYKAGQVLWVREMWGVVSHAFDDNEDIVPWNPDRPALPIHEKKFGQGYYDGHVIYAADGYFEWYQGASCWKSSTTMPLWASRLSLRITSVKCERLQDITEKDARLEGCVGYGDIEGPSDDFMKLWDSRHKPEESWAVNPWVFAYTTEIEEGA
jgi:hypothetical protein